MSIENKVREVLFSKEEIDRRVAELGAEITRDYRDKNLLVISLLKGSFIFTADLVRSIDLPVRIEFMTTSMYGHDEHNSGELRILQDTDAPLHEYDVLVVDDITDSALTMTGVLAALRKRNPLSLKACVLLDKPSRRRTEYTADYIGFEIPDKFIVGYGLNYGDYFRNVNHVFAFVDKEVN
ncbi:MAG: hypoxanthine phosphoribosyltransferase [Bacillota bacterium]|nr:hypoxanthine phosphoribosyltransferase [Bacillota bacterium]